MGKVIALGFFDGVHLGHQALFAKTREIADETGLLPAVFTFDCHPVSALSGRAVDLLNDLSTRKQLILQKGKMHTIIVQKFDTNFASLTWEQFVVQLQQEHDVAHIVCGHNFRFGAGGAGNTRNLGEKCKELGIGLSVVEEVRYAGEELCSTQIRKLLLEGKMEAANELLGQPHVLVGTVLHGRKLGCVIGAPTVNLKFPEQVLRLPNGAYATKVTLADGSVYLAATSIGTRPTVEEAGEILVESHLLDYTGDLYGQEIAVHFYHYLRREIKFAHLDALSVQIQADITSVRDMLEQ